MSVVVTPTTCPICSDALQPESTDYGIVWVCRTCRAFAANLAVLRKAAPRPFVKHLWLAATQLGVPSKQPCPSCAQPLLRFRPEVQVSPSCKVCCACFLVWFDAPAEAAVGLESSGAGLDALTQVFQGVERVAGALQSVGSRARKRLPKRRGNP
jgi:hypothetical protein